MQNPYRDLFQKKEPETTWVEGYMECLQCYEGVLQGRWNKKEQTLSYICSHGHESVIQGYSYE